MLELSHQLSLSDISELLIENTLCSFGVILRRRGQLGVFVPGALDEGGEGRVHDGKMARKGPFPRLLLINEAGFAERATGCR